MTRMAATSRQPEEFARATVVARESREKAAGEVADAVRLGIVEGDQMGGRSEVALRVQRLIEAEARIQRALVEQEQARSLGIPLAPAVAAEREARHALRAAVMGLAISAGAWVADLDHAQRVTEESRPSARNGRPARAREEDI